MSDTSAADGGNLRFMLRAFRYRNYRLFFGGQIISLVGTWLSTVASNWLVYLLASHADRPPALMLGLVGFANQIPVFLLTPLAGVWVDRWNRHTILLVTQSASMLQSFVLATLALGNWITIEQLVALNVLQGVVNAFDVPARQAFTVQMVDDRNDLSNAIALNSSMVHSARFVGPALAGYLIAAVGPGYCFLIDGFSYLAVLLGLALMRLAPVAQTQQRQPALESLLEGMRYAFGFGPIRTLLAMVAITSLVVMSQVTLMPIFAVQVLGGQERTLGWLLGSSGIGALMGCVYMASRRTVLGLGRVMAIACGTLGAALIVFSLSRSMYLSLPLLAVVGFAMLVQMASANTILQTIVDDDKRGRVMALYAMAFLGVAPFGSLLAGTLATMFNATLTVAAAGAICLVTSVVFALRLPTIRPLIRPIYRTKGILPQVAEGLQDSEAVSTAPQD